MPRALIVDDKPENLYFLAALLSGNGYSVDQAGNGIEALVSARANPPDLVISDILMPGMDGFALCRQWKQDPQLRGIPFVIYTATYTEPRDEKLALGLGADMFLVKPQEPEAFMEQINSVVQKQLAGQLLQPRAAEMEEAAYLREYNAALVRKLEDKLVQLQDLNKTLEDRVAERTALAERRAAQLRALAVRLAETEDRERRRLAEVLHDDLQQLLAAAQMHLGVLCHEVQGQESLQKRLTRIGALVDQSLQRARNLSQQLCPPTLHQLGFIDTLDWLARQMDEQYQLHVAIDADRDAEPHSPSLRGFLFRSVRELLCNVVKHSGTDQAVVRVARWDGRVVVEVSDQGKGFDPRQLVSGPAGLGGFGLFNIQQRVEEMGGTFEIHARGGGGTRVVLTVPDDVTVEASTPPAVPPEPETAVPRADLHENQPPYESSLRKTRLLLADDHKIMREGLASLLGCESDLEIVGHASDGRETIELARRLHPDVILMDVTMPIVDGIEATRQIKSSLPEIRIVGLSMHDRADMAEKMRQAGADDYLCKDGSSDKLLAAIRQGAVSPTVQ